MHNDDIEDPRSFRGRKLAIERRLIKQYLHMYLTWSMIVIAINVILNLHFYWNKGDESCEAL
jgi:uncharacterized membrane protein